MGYETNEYTPFLKNLAHQLNVTDRTEFVSFVREPLSIVASVDVVLMCSAKEAFGRVTIEAMKLGKPVVGANSGGTSELIIDGFNGLLYKVGSAEDLAAKIELFYKDRQLMDKMGQNGKKWANEKFNSEMHTTTLNKIIKHVI
jgi:L-malate glycosyltransferase